MKLNCIVVDDEPIARKILEKYCSHLADLTVIASCGDALQAREIIGREDVDIIFLDINMPVLDGIAFVKTLRNKSQVIFTTAYKEFAHEAFDLNACDYLLKPFSLERFLQSVDKAIERLSKDTSQQKDAVSYTYIKTEGKIVKVSFDELLYGEASGNNVRVVTTNHEFTPSMTFSAFEDLLPKATFIRVHRSFIINRNRIQVIEGNRVMIGAKEIPIGANYRDAFLKEIGVK
jgi:DNA-binding LytR/AlgR family response regulator